MEVQIIKIMADYHATGMWDGSDGIMIDNDIVPISNKLKLRLDNWNGYYNTNNQDYLESDKRTGHFDNEWFVAEGLQIANQFRIELPINYTILYFNETTHEVIEIK